MSAKSRPLDRLLRRKDRVQPAEEPERAPEAVEVVPVEIAPGDPILAYFQSAAGAVDIESLQLESPAKDSLVAAGVKMVVPLITQGELIGLLNLGSRLSEQEYSADDRKLLDTLAGQAAPAVRVAQLVRQQEAEARERERVEQELRVATLIQQRFLPRELPEIQNWRVAAYYRPAREVGGDFYDFFDLPGDRMGIVVGDVTDKGVPAALVMATTHSLIRAEAPRLISPSRVLERINDVLTPDMPPKMFVTCLYAVLEPSTGRIHFANAGHNLPFVRTREGVVELRATGMPLGLLPGMEYEEKEATINYGESMLLHSDGLAEAHSPESEMFGFPRVSKIMGDQSTEHKLIEELLDELDRFTGPNWLQEDDITLVTFQRTGPGDSRTVAEFAVPSEPGNEQLVMDRVAEAIGSSGLSKPRLERLKTAVSEAAMNAIEHGNKGRAELPVDVRVTVTPKELSVTITDQGGDHPIPAAETPDLEAKLAGLQNPRGWGLFLIKNMVDDMRVTTDGQHHRVELIVHLGEEEVEADGGQRS
jgi:serine phosphatase RsbU (regulator of sigma subunit)/anti-sigma regulatory factor (Ser/Thr protein kinase)